MEDINSATKNYKKFLIDAVKSMRIADHMTYVTYPLVNEKRLFIKILEEIYKTVLNGIKTIINYEEIPKITDSLLSDSDYITYFFSKDYQKKYNLTNLQMKGLREIIGINEKHKKSSVEFVKKDKMVIMTDNLKVEALNIRLIKEHLLLIKEFLMRISLKIR